MSGKNVKMRYVMANVIESRKMVFTECIKKLDVQCELLFLLINLFFLI